MAVYTITLMELIEMGLKIFDFEYDMKPQEHKTVFEELFIRHFYFREIGTETPGRFKYHLQTELMKLLPHYNKLYMSQGLEQRILDNYDVTEEFKRQTTSNSNIEETIGGSATANNNTTNQLSDTPVNRINISDNDYISSLTKEQNNSTQNINNKVDRLGNDQGNENWTRTMKGNIGIQTDADAVIKYESSLKNVDMLLLNELEVLFMGVF